MTIAELTIINDLLRGMKSAPRSEDWAERRAGMEANADIFPVPPEIELKPVTANGVPAEWQWRSSARTEATLLYFHGGGYAVGSIASHRSLTATIAQGFAGRVLSVGYRLAPEHPCPAAIDDAIAAYRYALDQGATRIVVAGDSAGGGLTIAALQAIRDAGLPAPAGAWCLSPWVDLTGTSGTMASKAEADLMIAAADLRVYGAAYAPGGDVNDPRATPLNGDFAGLPPLFIQVGTSEILLDDALSLAAKASAADVPVTLESWPGQPHVFQIFAPMLSEARDAIASAVAWCNRRID